MGGIPVQLSICLWHVVSPILYDDGVIRLLVLVAVAVSAEGGRGLRLLQSGGANFPFFIGGGEGFKW